MESIRRYEDSRRKNRGGKQDNWYYPSRGYGRDRRDNSRDYVGKVLTKEPRGDEIKIQQCSFL